MNNNLNDRPPEKSKPRRWLILLLIFFWWAALLVWICMGLNKSAKNSIARRNAKNNYGKYGMGKTNRRY